jgi:hypothetical protein
MFIEYKIGDQAWQADKHHVKHIEDNMGHLIEIDYAHRYYQLFGRLAGVRYDGIDALGLPNDVSSIIKGG